MRLLFAALALVAAQPLWAQLGDTPGSVERRFGLPIRRHARVRAGEILEAGPNEGDLYQRHGLYVRVLFQRGRAALVEVSPVAGELTPAQLATALDNNAEGSQWKAAGAQEGARYFRRVDGRAAASLVAGSLLIAADEDSALWHKLL